MSKLVEVKTPELSESVQSGSLLEWRKAAGERVERDEVLADLETDKVILEVAAPCAGVLKEIRVPAGGEVAAGEVLAIIEEGAGAALSKAEKPASDPSPSPTSTPTSTPIPAASADQPFLPPRLRGKPGGEPAQSAVPKSPPAPAAPAVSPVSPARAPSPVKVVSAPRAAVAGSGREERRVPMTRLRQRGDAVHLQ